MPSDEASRSFLLSFALSTARYATPLLYAASGGAISERGGIVNIALEGLLLGGAFASIAGASVASGTPVRVAIAVLAALVVGVCGFLGVKKRLNAGLSWVLVGAALASIAAAAIASNGVVGLLFGLGAGAVLAGVHALVTIRWKVNQIVSGVAINLLAAGLTKLLLQIQFHSASNASVSEATLPGGTAALVVLAFLAPVLAHLILESTTFGLRLRAAGEHPEAAASLGVCVGWVRAGGVVLSGLFAALGGVYLAHDISQFSANMSNGRGFMALAAVIFGGWRPLRALVACLLFGALEASADRLQAASTFFRETPEVVTVLPYVATLVVLAVTVRNARAPAALGR